MIDDWRHWAREFLKLLKKTEEKIQKGESGDPDEQQARYLELEAALQQAEPTFLALDLQKADLRESLQAAASAVDSDAALAELRDRLSIALMPLGRWHKQPEPAPVLWRNPATSEDNQWADAVLSEGEVAMLSGPGGIGKSYLALAWSLAATQNP